MTETLYLLIPLSVILVFLIGIAFWWSLKSGQFDDLEGPGYRILMDDDRARPQSVVEAEAPPPEDAAPPAEGAGPAAAAGKTAPDSAPDQRQP